MRVRVSSARMYEVRLVLARAAMDARDELDELLSRPGVSLERLVDAKAKFEGLRAAYDYVDGVTRR